MRFWPAALAVTVALSGCIGGHVTGTPRDATGNATFEAAGAGDDQGDAPPWVIKKDDAGGKDGTGGGQGKGETPPPTQPPDEPEEPDPGDGDGGPFGAADGDGIVEGVGHELEGVVGDDEDPLPGTEDVTNSASSTVNKTLDDAGP